MKQVIYQECKDNYGLSVIEAIPTTVKKALQEEKCYLAGGFIRSFFDHTINLEEVASCSILNFLEKQDIDIDIFCSSKEQAHRIMKVVLPDKEVKETENSVYGRLDSILEDRRGGVVVQAVYRWPAPDPETVIKGFDFVCCQAVIYYENNKFILKYHPQFRHDTFSKVLTYTQPIREEESAGSLVRALKYKGRGWNIPAEDLAELVYRASSGHIPAIKKSKKRVKEKAKKVKRITRSVRRVSRDNYC